MPPYLLENQFLSSLQHLSSFHHSLLNKMAATDHNNSQHYIILLKESCVCSTIYSPPNQNDKLLLLWALILTPKSPLLSPSVFPLLPSYQAQVQSSNLSSQEGGVKPCKSISPSLGPIRYNTSKAIKTATKTLPRPSLYKIGSIYWQMQEPTKCTQTAKLSTKHPS